MNNACPNCGGTGPNFSCPNHMTFWGINPLPDSIPFPQHGGITLTPPVNTELFAEIGRLNVLLNERDKENAALKQTSADLCSECGWRFLVPGIGCQGCERARLEQEIERLKGLMPPDERGPGFVGQGSWSVFAEKVVAERDTLNEEVEELRSLLDNLREKGIIDQHNRPLPLEGHHKDCGHGKDGWSLCTCDELRNRDARQFSELMNEVDTSTLTTSHVSNPKCPKCGDTGRVTVTDGVVATRGWCECSKEFKALVEEGQNLRKAFDKQTAGMRGPPQCSKCGDTGLVQVAPNARGVKQCECKKYGPHHPECGRAKPGMRSPCNCLGLYERDARNQRDLDRCFDELVEDDKVTCDHGNTECKRCGVGQPTIKTPEGKPLLPPTEFSAMRIEDNRERGITECNFQRQTGRTTAMVLKALEFVKENATGAVVIEVHNPTMKKRIKDLLKHYSDETGVRHDQLSRVCVRAPGEYSPGGALNLRDNVFDDMKENKPTRDPRQDLKVGDRVRFELKGHIEERQSAGIIQDGDGNDFEPVQYLIRDEWHRRVHIIPYNEITLVIGKVKE